jgi:hypothetical protein
MSLMNDLIRKGGRGSKTGTMPDMTIDIMPEAKGSRDFTVQQPGVHSPTDQFIYEPSDLADGAWVVYPPGVPCDPSNVRISRATPADVADFPKMQTALDEESSEPASEPQTAESTETDTGSY